MNRTALSSLYATLLLAALAVVAHAQSTGGPGGGGPTGGGPGGGGTVITNPGGSTGTGPGGGGDDGGTTIVGPGGINGPGGGVTEPTIIAPRGALAGDPITATVVLPGGGGPGQTTTATYQWSVSGARVTSPSLRDATIELVADKAGTVSLAVSVTYDGENYNPTASITILSATVAGKITAPASVATSAATASASVPAAQNGDRTFAWSISGDGAIVGATDSATVTFKPGSPGLKELTCAVNLQNIVRVALRAHVVVTGDGPPVVVTVNNGTGGGTHNGGSRVDIFASPPAAGQVFDRWTGDTSALGADEAVRPHVLLTVPFRAVTLTATYKAAAAWTPVTVANFPEAKNALIYYVPANARGLVFLLHDSGEEAGNWFTRPEGVLLTRDFVAAGLGVAALSSADRTRGGWSVATALETNPDARNHATALDKLVRENLLAANKPLFFLGVGGGGDAAAQIAEILATTAPTRPVKGTVLFCTGGSEALALTSHVPQFYALAGSAGADGGGATVVVSSFGSGGDARANQQFLIGRGIATDLVSTTRAPVYADRFRALALSATEAQSVWTALKAADLLDANNFVRELPELADVQSALPIALRGRAADVLSELAVADISTALYSESDARILSFIDARIAGAPAAAPGRLVNLSTRTKITYLGDTFTVGFNLAGPEKATLLIRGIGPALAKFGVETALLAPRLEVHRGGTLIASNEGWDKTGNSSVLAAAAASVGAFALAPGDLDSAVLLTLDPGSYTASVSGLGGVTGDILAEIYDVSRNATRLANLSALGKISSEGDVLLPALVVQGGAPRTLIARAVGAGLSEVGVDAASVLGDPRLTVLSASGAAVKANDNWSFGSGPAISAASTVVGAFPLKSNSTDAALDIALAPGSYTVRVDVAPRSSAAQQAAAVNATGSVLVEIYEVP